MDNTIGNDVTIRPKAERGTGAFVPGDVIAGRYVVEKVLGEGGMGIVYQCLDKVGGVSVAVKCLPPEVSRNEDEMEDIRANYRLVADLHHPNIAGARTLELDGSTGDYYLVMDLAAGMTLKRWARHHPDADLGAKLAILRQIAAALDYAHAEKVIHRDVKPENVMVDDDERVKVLDFGLAAQIRSSQSRTSNTVTSKGGTPGYKSPEQWLGRPQQAPADVYAFGVMAYWLFSGRLPFDGDDLTVLGHAVLSAPVEPIPDLPAHMNAALAKSLAKKPEDRFPSCTAFVDALEGKVGSRVPRDRMGGPRSRATAILAAVLSIAVAGGWWYYRQEQVREQARITAEAERQKAAAEETKRKAEEEARQKAAAEEAKRKAEEAARQKAAAEEAERIAKASATEIRIEARVQQSAVRNISDEDGFRAKKDKLDKDFARADALFDEKAKRWSAAAVLFTNYVAGCKALLKLDGERQRAMGARTKAGEAKGNAEKAEAEKYAQTCWNEAVRLLVSANAHLAGMQFADAERSFASAAKQFDLCVDDAKAEKKRREDAAAQAKAEKEARERAEAEARERAAKEARERERRAKWHKEGEEFTINDPYGLYMTMKWCPAGSFTMGSPATEEGRSDNERQHQVTLTKGFWMGETEVTQGQWKRIMDGETIVDLARKGLQDDTEYMIVGKKRMLREYWKMDRNGDPNNRCGDLNDNVPVYYVNWYEAVEFCRRLTQRERADGRIPDDYEYRLPTEAEWEYACRAGTTESLPNGRDICILGKHNAPALDDIAWYGGNSSVGFQGRGIDTSNWTERQYPGEWAYVRVVKGKHPNKWGLYDMIGNVCEWCNDWYKEYGGESVVDPIGALSGECHVLRGGSWSGGISMCRSAFRWRDSPGIRSNILGFRVALAPITEGISSVWQNQQAQSSNSLKVVTTNTGDAKTITLPGGATMEMIYVAPGTFTMGSPTSENGHDDDETQHPVTLTKGYWLGKFEVTQAQWQSVMGENPSSFKGGNRPMENISWKDCQIFISKINAQLNCGARLPTEAEWEYACRAGSTGDFGGTGALDEMGWYSNNSGNQTHPVGQKKSNDWGFHDMHGNVWEWCNDWYGKYYGAATDPTGPASGGYRVLRGGCWPNFARNCRSAYRSRLNPVNRVSGYGGFRLCCSAGPRE